MLVDVSGRQIKTRVMVCIPVATHWITSQLAMFLLYLERVGNDPRFPWAFEFTIINGRSPVPFARNELVSKFLATDCELLWFWDEDMLPRKECLQLLSVDADIACGPYDMLDLRAGDDTSSGIRTMVWKRQGNRFIHAVPGPDPVEDIDSAGTGNMVIRRKVFKEPRMLLDDAPTDFPPFFRDVSLPNGRRVCTEDFDFCCRAKDLGYSVKVDWRCAAGHLKGCDIRQFFSVAVRTASESLTAAAKG